MHHLFSSLTLILALINSLSAEKPEFVTTDDNIQQYFQVGNLNNLTGLNTDKKIESYNIHSGNIINSVAVKAVENSPSLIPCYDTDGCDLKLKLSPTPMILPTLKITPSPVPLPTNSPVPTLSPILTPTLIPQLSNFPRPKPSCPPPPCYRGSGNDSGQMPCMLIDLQQSASDSPAIECPQY